MPLLPPTINERCPAIEVLMVVFLLQVGVGLCETQPAAIGSVVKGEPR
jgi:hypothetical protein